MALTTEGLDFLGQALLADLQKGAVSLRVGDGSQTAEAPLVKPPEYVGVLTGQPEPPETDEPPEPPETVTLVRISLTAEFGPNAANFEWTETAIICDGAVIDASAVDLGRKAQGTAWTLETFFDAVVD